MDLSDIENDLRRRIDESVQWLGSGNGTVIEGLQARSTPCNATAVGIIDDKKRKESDGIKFHLVFGKPKRQYSATVEVRIKSTGSAAQNGTGLANGPYIAVYVLDINSGKGQLSYFERFENAEVYFRTVENSIQEWYALWLRRLLNRREGATVFNHMQPVVQ